MSPRHLVHILASGEWNGPERYAFDICRYFKDSGWKITVLTRDAKAIDKNFLEEGLEVRHAPLRDYPDLFSAKKLSRIFKDIPRGEGIVHTHRYNDALTAIMARKLSRRPDIRIITTRHKAAPASDGWLQRIVYRRIDSHLFVSEFSKRLFYSRWEGSTAPLSPDKTGITYNSLYNPEIPERDISDKGPIQIAYRGSLKPGKGLETIIIALSLLTKHKIRLKIAGKGKPDYVDRLRGLAQSLGVAQKIDWIRNTEFPYEELNKIHFGVFPNHSPEAFGMANLELMAMGKPQISTFTGPEEEFLTPGEDAIRVAPNDPEALADAIARLADDSDMRRQMGRNALTHYNEKFSWPEFIKRLTPYYYGT